MQSYGECHLEMEIYFLIFIIIIFYFDVVCVFNIELGTYVKNFIDDSNL